MATKKKPSTKEKTVNVTSDGMISYRGKVTVEYLRGGKSYKSFTAHNQGCMPLFRFIGRCLLEDYTVTSAPYGIRLFRCDTDKMDSESSIFADGLIEKTTAIIPKNAATLSIDNKSKSVTANISFLIPFTSLVDDSGSTQNRGSNVIAVYSREGSTERYSPMAFFRMADKQSDGTWEDNDGVIVGDGKSNIKITWSMTVNGGSASD